VLSYLHFTNRYINKITFLLLIYSFQREYLHLLTKGILQSLEAKSTFIVKDGVTTYEQLVPEIKTAPDYEAILNAI